MQPGREESDAPAADGRSERVPRPADASPRGETDADAWAAAFAAGGLVIRRHRITRTPLVVGPDPLDGGDSLGSFVYRDPWRQYRVLGDPPVRPEATSGYPSSVWLARDEYPADAPPEAIPPDTPPARPPVGDAAEAARAALTRHEEIARALRGALAAVAPTASATDHPTGTTDVLAALLDGVGVAPADAAGLARHARRVAKGEAAALAWLVEATPPGLAGATPLDVARGGEIERVHRALHDIEHGGARAADGGG
jgi:hypothetical protein